MVFDSVSECWHGVPAECEATVSTHEHPENVDGYCTVVHILWGEMLSFSVKPISRYSSHQVLKD